MLDAALATVALLKKGKIDTTFNYLQAQQIGGVESINSALMSVFLSVFKL